MLSSSLSSWALLIYRALKEGGHNPVHVFKSVNADIDKLGDGQARYDIKTMHKLWNAAIKTTDDQDFGVEAGERWCPTTFHAFGFAWLASSSLHDGVQRACRYASLVNNSIGVGCNVEGQHYFIEIQTKGDAKYVHPAAIDAGLTSIIKMCRMLVGDNFTPLELFLSRKRRIPGALEGYASCDAQYDMPNNGLVLDAKIAEAELPTGNAALASINDHAAAEYLQRINRENTVGAVRTQITQLLPKGDVGEEIVAKKLHLNVRTLQRKLSDEGTTFRQLVNSTREDLAMDYIRNSHLSLTEITYLLGFSDQANFTRAFKRWTSQTPSEYRNQAPAKALSLL